MNKKKKHKYNIGDIIKVKNTPYVSERLRKKYGHIVALWKSDDEPEYKVVIQGMPDRYWILFQSEINLELYE